MDEMTMYCNLMEEVKRRTAVVHGFLDGRSMTLYNATNVECMVLQVRKILELVALGSLVAHRAEYSRQHSNFGRHWHAERILQGIKRINPGFYPQPVREVPSPFEGVKRDLVDVKDGFLTMDKFIEVYDRCSQVLHARNPFADSAEIALYDVPISHWMVQIQSLLNTHIIRLLGEERFLLVHMEEEQDGKVHAYTFQRLT